MGEGDSIKVVCNDCPFKQCVDSAERDPSEVIITHGRETGHTLTISSCDD